MSRLNTPLNEALRYVRRIAAADPVFHQGPTLDKDVTVINIETLPTTWRESVTLLLDLDDGTTIKVVVSRDKRDEYDEERVQESRR